MLSNVASIRMSFCHKGSSTISLPCGQKTQTHCSRSVYGPTIVRSLSCNPLRYRPYSPLMRDNDWSGMTHGLEATAGVYHELRRLGGYASSMA